MLKKLDISYLTTTHIFDYGKYIFLRIFTPKNIKNPQKERQNVFFIEYYHMVGFFLSFTHIEGQGSPRSIGSFSGSWWDFPESGSLAYSITTTFCLPFYDLLILYFEMNLFYSCYTFFTTVCSVGAFYIVPTSPPCQSYRRFF